MATTLYAQRCQELKNRYANNAKSKDPSFTTQYNALWHLANMKRLSRHNVIWLGKQIIQMTETWSEQAQQEVIETLRERQARAWKRWEARIAERAAAKAAGAGRRGRPKNKPTTPAPVPLPQDLDPWSL